MATEYTPPGDPTEVLGRRAVALFIDVALLGVIGLTLFALLRYRLYSNVEVNACRQLTKAGGSPLCLKLGSHVFLWHKGALKLTVLVVLFLGFLDGVVLQSITGSTVGKFCTRLSVVDESGKKAHPLRMFGRWVMLVIDLGLLLVGCIVTGATHPHRRLGDFVFGTYVVSMSSVGRPIADWLQGGAGRGGAENGQASFGEPATWTTPPVPVPAPVPAATAPPTRPIPAPILPVATPPGTTPTPPGEWGAVARPAPLVRSPQWETPPATDTSAPPASVPTGPTPWAAPPAERETDPPADADADEADAKTDAKDSAPKDGEAKTDPKIDAKTDAKHDEKSDEPEPEDALEAEVVDDADTDDSEPDDSEPDDADTDDAEPEPEKDAEAKTEPEKDAEPEKEPEPEVELELEADLGDEEESTSQWKPVESASAKSRARSASGKDDSWWDEALSSGDSETESES
jgi:uncharacterized RDD family membrane protein YckC